MFAEPIGRFLSAIGYRVLAPVTDVFRIRSAVRAHRPDVLILDVHFGDHDALPELRSFVLDSPATRVVVVTGYGNTLEWNQRALAAGARGFVSKDCGPKALAAALHAVLNGYAYAYDKRIAVKEAPLEPSAAQSTIGISPSCTDLMKTLMTKAGLSRALAETAVLLHAELAVERVAIRLGLSVFTVRGRIRRLHRVMNVNTNSQVILIVERCFGEFRHSAASAESSGLPD